MSSSESQSPHFSGESGRACETFIRDIRSHAFKNGKQRDNEWQADFAATCLDGPALRWFEEQSMEIQEDWGLLRKAMLDRWPLDYVNSDDAPARPPMSAASAPLSAASIETIPTPAAAPPTPARAFPPPASPVGRSGSARSVSSGAPPPPVRVPAPRPPGPSYVRSVRSPSVSSTAPAVRRGKIKMTIDLGDSETKVRYVRRSTGWFGLFKTTSKAGDGLVVEYTQPTGGESRTTLRMINGPSSYEYLGIKWEKQKIILGKGSNHRAEVTPVSTSGESASSNDGTIGSKIWKIDDQDVIHAFWEDEHGAVFELDFQVMSDWLYVAADQAAYADDQGSHHVKAVWTFEPL